MNKNAPHLKSPKNQNRRAVMGRASMKLLDYWGGGGGAGGLELVCGRPTSPLVRPWFITQNNYNESNTIQNKNKSIKTLNIYFHLFSIFFLL